MSDKPTDEEIAEAVKKRIAARPYFASNGKQIKTMREFVDAWNENADGSSNQRVNNGRDIN